MIAKTILLTLCATLATACAGTHANQATAAAATAPTHTCHHTGLKSVSASMNTKPLIRVRS